MNCNFDLKVLKLDLFAAEVPDLNPNTTTDAGLTDEIKTYYDKRLIMLAEPELIHDQFAQTKNIPANGGKTIEFRQYDPLPELTPPLVEGVTPGGQDLSMHKIEATVDQYGGYVTLSDMLILTAIDPNVLIAQKSTASQAGRTLDTITRDVINAGTVVEYAGGATSRANLGYTDANTNNNITVDAIRRAVRTLDNNSAPKIGGTHYGGIIHPYVKYDLLSDPAWKFPHEYKDTENIYRNEIGELYGVRFVESPRAMKWEKAGASQADVYSTLIVADDAYGTTTVEGGGLEHIQKQLGSAGTADPLNQRATVGWKAIKTAEILVEQYMVRIESTATP